MARLREPSGARQAVAMAAAATSAAATSAAATPVAEQGPGRLLRARRVRRPRARHVASETGSRRAGVFRRGWRGTRRAATVGGLGIDVDGVFQRGSARGVI